MSFISNFNLVYTFSVKQTVHPGNSENKGLLLDPCHLMVHSVVSAFACILPDKKSTEKVSV